MTTISTPDALRKSVEAASGGKQTVLYTSKGYPTHMNVIPAFNCEDLHPTALGTGRHPAFFVDGVEKAEIFVGTYQAIIHDGQALSLPYQNPKVLINFDNAKAACFAAGPGFHLMTNWEWAAIALWMAKNGYSDLRGNTDYGKSHSHPEEKGMIAEYGKTLTGSGPETWRHDGTLHGIADLVGNVWEWVDGLKLVSGKILIPTDNNFNLAEQNWPDTGACIDCPGGPQISDEVSTRGWDYSAFKDAPVKEGYEPPVALKQAVISPCESLAGPGYFGADNDEDCERLPIRGGNWRRTSDAGVFALNLNNPRSTVSASVGFRCAYVI